MRSDRSNLGRTWMLIVALALGGCTVSNVPKTVVSTVGTKSDQDLDFWHDLAEAPLASNDDAFHALLLYFDGSDAFPDYPARVAELKKRKWLADSFNEPAQRATTRGVLSVSIARALKMRGGVTMAVIGPNERYATRELVYVGLLPPSAPYQELSGADLVGVVGRIEDYQRSHGMGTQGASTP